MKLLIPAQLRTLQHNALLPLYGCEDDFSAGRLVRVLPEWTPLTKYVSRIAAVATPERMQLPRNRELLAYLRERLSRADPLSIWTDRV